MMIDEENFDEISFGEIILILWEKKILIIGMAVLFALASILYTVIQPKMYESKTTLLILPHVLEEMDTRQENERGGVFASDIYLSLAGAGDLADDVLREFYKNSSLGDGSKITTDEFIRNMKVKVGEPPKGVSHSNEIMITASLKSSSPQQTVDLLNIWSAMFIQRNSQLFMDKNVASLGYVSESFSNVKKDLEKTENELLAFNTENREAILRSRMDSLIKSHADYTAKYNLNSQLLPVVEANIKTLKSLLAQEPVTIRLNRGMSGEALWNFLSKNVDARQLKALEDLNIKDEELNTQNVSLKGLLYASETKSAELKASLTGLKKAIAQTEQEHELKKNMLLKIQNQREKLEREKASLIKLHAILLEKYQISKIATLETSDPIRVIEKPVLQKYPASRNGLKTLLLATLLGIFCGVTTAFGIYAVKNSQIKVKE